ncbi:M24 family metallopeptidase [Paenibacillus cymbidii]|uniref:M24 family metallopeptidase n=1 Tax=Paenibacillus cymbidii TaxID=1639034 RepID=UPI0010819EA1|nr:Xaa-Pro peptidase family protein [Paenibacillus cymbidii]
MEQKRLARLRQAMASGQLEAALITNGHNRRYLTGFTGTSGYVLVTADKSYFLTDFRYMTQAAAETSGYEIVEHKPNPWETVKELLAESHIGQLAFEQADVSFGTYRKLGDALPDITLVPADQLVDKLRMIKDASELAVIAEAAELADRTFEWIKGKLKPGVTEKEIALEMEMYMRQNGATSSSFDTIVASGERSALPHGVASDRKLAANEFVKLDFGAYYKGYCSDLTRTVVLGKPNAKHKEIYDIVLEAQLNVLDKLRPGMTGVEGDALARDLIEKAGYGDRFGHGTGHSFGMEIHESPRLSRLCDTVLEPGMTMTVEPGIYLPGFGGVRIEDDIVMTETGIRLLTHAPKTFTTID